MVTADERLLGPRSKIQRAEDHIKDLEVRYWAFIRDTEPYGIRREDDAKEGRWVYLVSKLDPFPTDLSLIVGDVVHNVRTALDLLAWQLVVANNGTPTTDTAFPIWRAPRVPKLDELKALAGGKLKGAHPDVIAAVVGMEPYRGGNGERIWTIDALDLIDKHRLLLLTATGVEGVIVDGIVMFEALGIDMSGYDRDALKIAWRPVDRRLEMGTQVYSVPYEHANPNQEFTFAVSLDEPGIVEMEPAVPFLTDLAQSTRQTIEAFAPFLG